MADSRSGSRVNNIHNNSSDKKRKRQNAEESPSHTRILAACDACRTGKTRCDAVRPACGKCLRRGIECVYSAKDPFSAFEMLGEKVLEAIEKQGHLLQSLVQDRRTAILNHTDDAPLHQSDDSSDDAEVMSRKDTRWTPITGSEMILRWSVFPKDKPFSTFPASEYTEKQKPFSLGDETMPSPERMFQLRDIFMAKIQIKNPIVDAEQLDANIADIVENGLDWTSTSCLVLLVLALAAIWGNYPDDFRPSLRKSSRKDLDATRVPLAIPDERMKESLSYFAMAQKRLFAAQTDDSLVGVVCFCLCGMWYQYNIEPIPGWKMFRTASTMWEAYNLKHTDGKTRRPDHEESLEQRLYWTCLKSECEIRHELYGLPPCTLQESTFPHSLPTFPTSGSFSSTGMTTESFSAAQPPNLSYYYYLAEISLRRLLNRIRSATTILSPEIDSNTASNLAATLQNLDGQLQQWLDCLPAVLRFNVPPDTLPVPDEPELVKLMRERYVEVREHICRAYLYMCLHGGGRLTRAQAEEYGAHASAGLRLSIYRIETEVPYFRHPGSWGACRVRFNHALCLIAAHCGTQANLQSASHVVVPPTWRECVRKVQGRLESWGDQGGGIRQLGLLLHWLMESVVP